MPPNVPLTPRPPPPVGTPNTAKKKPKNRRGTPPREIDTSPRDFGDDFEPSGKTVTSSTSGSFSGGTSSSGTNIQSNTPTGNSASTGNGCPNGNCMPPPDGRTFRLDNATVTEPQALTTLLEPILNDLIATGKLLLLVRLNRPSSWLIQGVRKGAGYGNSDNFPTYRVNLHQSSAVKRIALRHLYQIPGKTMPSPYSSVTRAFPKVMGNAYTRLSHLWMCE